MTDVVEIGRSDWVVVVAPGITETIAVPSPTLDLVEIAEQGPAGPPGVPGPAGGAAMIFTAATPIGGHRVLALDAFNDVIYASADDPGTLNKIIGMSMNAAAAGGDLSVVLFGEVIEPSWNWDPALPVYLGTNGVPTQTPPASPGSSYSLIVGFPTAATGLFLSVREPITLI